MRFCARCFKVLSERWAKKAGYDPRYKLDVKNMVFPCQVPIYEPSSTGEPLVRVWDCVNNVSVVYTSEQFKAKQKEERKKKNETGKD